MDDVVGGASLDRVVILRCLYRYEDGRAGYAGRVLQTRRPEHANSKHSFAGATKVGSS